MKYVWFLPLILLMAVPLQIGAQCSRNTDSLVLVSIFNQTLGTGWTNKTNWLVPGKSISTWYGVRLNPSGCVESIVLSSNKMNGLLPDSVGLLTGLKVLNLSNNNLAGNLPVSMGTLAALEELNLSSNQFNGPVHSQLGNLSNLRKLQLSLNNFSGNLPSALGNLKNLVILHLNQNSLGGFLSPSFGGLDNLEEMLLSQNNIAGQIPSQIGNLAKLRLLALSQNKLTGSIPKALGNLKALKFFYADENRLSGAIPPEIGNVDGLQELWLHKNMISGTLPAEISNLTNLQKLLLNDNQISGEIPSFIGNLTRLISFHISNNQLTGSIPVSLGNLPNLISLLISDNQLTGGLPSSLGMLGSLISFDAHNNQLSGEIPATFGNMASLRRIYLHNNSLEGCFPVSMQKFCPLGQSSNVNASGYNFLQNPDLIFGGDFTRWCTGEGRADAVITAPAQLCEGSDLMLMGAGGVSYEWTGPMQFYSTHKDPVVNDISASQFGRYFLIVRNENRCLDTSFVDVSPVGNVSSASNSPVCQGDTIRLTAAGGNSYLWKGPGGFSSTLPNPVIPDAGPEREGTYTVDIITDDCTITRAVEVNFNKSASLMTNSPVCEGDTLLMEVSSGQSFMWSGPEQFASSARKAVVPITRQASAGDYTVEVKDASGCVFTLKAEVTVSPRLIPLFDDLGPLCGYSAAIPLPGLSGDVTGIWSGLGVSGLAGEQMFSPDNLSGVQDLVFTPADTGRCLGQAKKELFVSNLSIASVETQFSANDDDSDGSAVLTLDLNADHYRVDLTGTKSEQFNNLSSTQLSFFQLGSGPYDVTLTDSNGCVDTASFVIKYAKPFYYLPNVMSASPSSPNNRFFVQGRNINSYDLYVYDRWGNKVFDGNSLQANDEAAAWQPAKGQNGVFVYLARIRSELGEKVIKGAVTVL